MSLLFNMLSRLVIIFLPRGKHLLISWLQSPSAVNLEPRKINSVTFSTVSPSICYEVMGPDAMILFFWMLSFKPSFLLPSFTFIKRLFSSSSLCHKGCVICISEVIDISPSNLDSSLCFIQSSIPHYIFTQTHGIYSTNSESSVNYGLLVIMCQYRFTNINDVPLWWGMLIMQEAPTAPMYMCWEQKINETSFYLINVFRCLPFNLLWT